MTVTVHRKQWIITKSDTPPRLVSHFRTLKLGYGVHLHYEPSLSVRCIGAGPASPVLVGTLIGNDLDEGCGRFVMVDFPWLRLDATGSMGVYYFKHPQDAICSSSVALMAETIGETVAGRELRSDQGINWDPVPSGRIPRLRKLFCDQSLDLSTGELLHSPANIDIKEHLELPTAADKLALYLQSTLKTVALTQRPLFLGLTAGLDSRTIFCALHASEIDFEAFTMVWNERSKKDAKIASALCDKFGIQHRRIASSNERHSEELIKLRSHTAGAEGDVAKEHIRGNLYRDLPDDAIVLHGGIFELGRRFYEERFKIVDFSTSAQAAIGICLAFSQSPERILAPLRLWYLYRKKSPIQGMDYVDMFYLDQRRAGWGAANQQAHDAFGPEQIMVANSPTAIRILMSPPIESRRNGGLQLRSAETMLPGATRSPPINPPNMASKIRGELKRLAYRSPAFVRSLRAMSRRFRSRH